MQGWGRTIVKWRRTGELRGLLSRPTGPCPGAARTRGSCSRPMHARALMSGLSARSATCPVALPPAIAPAQDRRHAQGQLPG